MNAPRADRAVRPVTQRELPPATLIDRLPPQSLEAEQAVLGSMLVSLPACEEAFALLDEADFYHHGHRRMFAAMRYLSEREIPPDLRTVPEELTRLGHLDGIGGLAYLGRVDRVGLRHDALGRGGALRDAGGGSRGVVACEADAHGLGGGDAHADHAPDGGGMGAVAGGGGGGMSRSFPIAALMRVTNGPHKGAIGRVVEGSVLGGKPVYTLQTTDDGHVLRGILGADLEREYDVRMIPAARLEALEQLAQIAGETYTRLDNGVIRTSGHLCRMCDALDALRATGWEPQP